MDKPLIYNKWPAQNEDILQLYSLATPNGIKVGVALEEMGIEYEPHTINILQGDQHTDEFKSLNPNAKIPAIIDPNGPDGKMVSMMESCAILLYLAKKSNRFLPSDPLEQNECIQWLFFQVGHIGPMFGQFGHFYKFAGDNCKDPYPLERYKTETIRLLDILEQRLSDRDFIMGANYTIADIAIFPWVETLNGFYQAGEAIGYANFKNVVTWISRCGSRPAVEKGRTVCSISH
jgi:GSH-dependent disulfide-bond oxidoreductase